MQAETLLTSAMLPITANIVGSITPSPRIVLFGSISNGKENKKLVLLSAESEQIFEGMKITCENKWISTNLREPQTTGNHTKYVVQPLEIILSPNAPVGPIRTYVNLKTSKGEIILIHIIAEITSGK